MCVCIFKKINVVFYFPALSFELKSKVGMPSHQFKPSVLCLAVPTVGPHTRPSQRQYSASHMLSTEDKWDLREGTGEASGAAEASQHSG